MPIKRYVLTIDDESKRKARELVEFASRPENHYRPRPFGGFVPGCDPRHCVRFESHRCVFSVTIYDGIAYRHLSISAPEVGDYPAVGAVATIATWFGFTGAVGLDGDEADIKVNVSPRWHVFLDGEHGAIVVAQELEN